MKFLNNLALKQLKYNKKRSLVTIIGIILSSTLLFTIGFAFSTIRQIAIDDAVKQNGSQHMTINNLPYENIDVLKYDKKIKTLITEQLIKKESFKWDSITYQTAYYVAYNIDLKDYLTLSNGRFPENKNEILISYGLSTNLKYATGDKIGDNTIVGVYKASKIHNYDRQNNGWYTNDYIYTIENIDPLKVVNCYITYKSIDNIYSKIYNTAVMLNLKIKTDKKNKEVYIYDQIGINYPLLTASGEVEASRDQVAIYLYLTVILTVLSVVAIFLIYNSFNISLSEREKHLGILRSIGTTKKQLYASVFYEAGLLSIIAIPIGFLVSIGIVKILLMIVNNMLKTIIASSYNLTIYPSFILISLLFIILTILLSSWVAARQARRIQPIELIGNHIDFFKSDIKNSRLINKLFGFEGSLAYKNIRRNIDKYYITMVSLCISIVLFITFSTIINYGIKGYQYDAGNDHDINITIPDSVDQEKVIKEISNIKSIDEMVKYRSVFLYFKSLTQKEYTANYYKYSSNKGFDSITIFGLDNENYNAYLKKLKIKDSNKLILYNHTQYSEMDSTNSFFLELKFNIFRDSNIKLELCNVEVLNYTQSNKITFEGHGCYLTLDDFYLTNINFFEKQDWGPIIITSMDKYQSIVDTYANNENFIEKESDNLNYSNVINLGINAKKFKDFDADMQSILDKHTSLGINYYNQKLMNYNDYISNMAVIFLLYSIIAFVGIIAVTSVFNTINTSIHLREKEFSMLRSIGLSKKGFNKMIRLESFFLGFKALYYGIPIALFVIFILFNISYFQTKKITMIFPTKYLIICFVAIILIIFLTMLYSSNKIKKKNIIDSLKNDNI